MFLSRRVHLSRHVAAHASLPAISFSSVAPPTTVAALRATLLARPHNLLHDYLTPVPRHLLETSLQDLFAALPHPLPPSSDPPPVLPHTTVACALPLGTHLVHFPPAIPPTALLPDGTDTLHDAGPPFVRRMWMGGRVAARPGPALRLDGARAVCLEGIRAVRTRARGGAADDETASLDAVDTVVVSVERRVASCAALGLRAGAAAEDERRRVDELLWTADEEDFGAHAAVIERRDLVFLRARTAAERESALRQTEPRVIRAPSSSPAFAVPFTPSPALLFRFSALTFNAHAIHLDPRFAAAVEAYPARLVHGGLALVLLLAVLRGHLPPGAVVTAVEYRNLSPLYEAREMRICGRPRGEDANGARRWDVWILDDRGSLAVRAAATVT